MNIRVYGKTLSVSMATEMSGGGTQPPKPPKAPVKKPGKKNK